MKRDLNRLNHSHGRSSDAIRAGRAAEEFHQRCFNADAIKQDIPTRAQDMPYHSPSDFRVGDQDVQLKYGFKQYCKTIDQPKYDGMQKIVPKEHADATKGWSDRIEVEGARSKPLSQKDAKSLVKNPWIVSCQRIPFLSQASRKD